MPSRAPGTDDPVAMARHVKETAYFLRADMVGICELPPYAVYSHEALTGKPLARCWLHSELVLVDGKMMSAEHGNVITLRDILARGFTAREIRFMLLTVHYRKPIQFSFKRLENVRTALRRLDEFT